MKMDLSTLGGRIRYIRSYHQLTQKAFCHMIHVDCSWLSQLENNKRTPSDATLYAICSVFHVREEWLRNEKGEIFNREDQELLEKVHSVFCLSDAEMNVTANYLNMTQEDRTRFAEYILRLASSYKVR